MRVSTLVLGGAFSLALSTQAMAFATNMCFDKRISWGTNNPTLNASAISFPTGYWRDGLQRATDLTNANPSPFFFTLGTDTNGLNVNNGESEVWGTTDTALLNGAPARAFIWWTCFQVGGVTTQHINEGDVIFDFQTPFQWTADELKSSIIRYTGTLRQLQGTAVHEFGHALGLNHVNTEYNVMGTDFEHIWANGSAARGYLGEDAADGVVALYGPWSFAWQDLGVAHWRFFGANGEYSDHEKTAVYNSADVLRPTVDVRGETGYRVRRGQNVRVEFTYENNGRDSQTVNTGWYISTNDVISTADRLIATNTGMTLSRGDVLTFRRDLTIPSDLKSGRRYYLGTIVDKDGAVADQVPSNNATYIPLKVR